jgi:hypothetical protein
MHTGIKIFCLLAGFWILSACTEVKDIDSEDQGWAYFPLKVGQYVIFDVNGVQYNNFNDSVVFSYQLKESVVDSFQNLESGVSYKILREKRADASVSWETDSLWTSRKDVLRAVRVENNVPVISLTFPLKENKSWDANGLNDKPSANYEMVKVGQPYVGINHSFNETVTVIQEDIPDKIVNFISKKEIYSRDVGMVYKENIILKYRQGDFLGLEVVDSGIRYFQSLSEYGEK